MGFVRNNEKGRKNKFCSKCIKFRKKVSERPKLDLSIKIKETKKKCRDKLRNAKKKENRLVRNVSNYKIILTKENLRI